MYLKPTFMDICFIVFCLLVAVLFIFTRCFPSSHHTEKWYVTQWCKDHQGQIEAKLPSKARCDCITPDYAIEFDFAPKWAEAIGQSLYYSFLSNKKAGIVLIIEDPSDIIYLFRLDSTIKFFNLPIKVWKIGCEQAIEVD